MINGITDPTAPGRDAAAGEDQALMNSTDPEVMRLSLQVLALSAENERLRDTISYRLGNLLVRAKTWRGLLGLPIGLVRLVRLSRQRRGRTLRDRFRFKVETENRLQRLSRDVLSVAVDTTVKAAVKDCRDIKLAARLIAELASSVQRLDPEKSLALARRTVVLDPSPQRQLWLAGFLYDAGMIEEPRQLYQFAIQQMGTVPERARLRSEMIEGLIRTNATGLAIPARQTPRPTRDASLLYVAASSFPHHVTGYATRTHSLVKALAASGQRVEVVTRPGYPWDRNDAQGVPPWSGRQEVNDVVYTRLPGPPANATPFDDYCRSAAGALLKHIHRVNPAFVHAASNYVNAAPALIAARRAGLPFVYEIRGLWELTHAARLPHWDNSEHFKFQRARETEIAQAADAVVAISYGLKSELVARGVEERKILVVPNSVDPTVFRPQARDGALARELALESSHVLGFLGSMTGYEGLVDLVHAIARLRAEGLDVSGLLVGDGPAFREVREAARCLGILDHLVMPGRVPHGETPRWYSLMDVAVYPRRPARVTELVPPLKPLEAMAMELPIVASDVSAIAETVIDREAGYLFPKGDVEALTALLREVLAHPDAAREVARNARRHVEENYTWERAATRLGELYASVAEEARTSVSAPTAALGVTRAAARVR